MEQGERLHDHHHWFDPFIKTQVPSSTTSNRDTHESRPIPPYGSEQHGLSGFWRRMESENRQLTHLREQLTMLLSTHLPNLPHQVLTAVSGDVLIRQNAAAKRVLLVKSGELRIERLEEGGTPKVIAVVGANELVGEMALIGEPRHSATVTVHHGPAEILSIRSNDLLQAALYDSDLVMELLALCSTRCRKSNHHLALLLEGLEALSRRDHQALELCCNRLGSRAESGLAHAAELLRQLEKHLGPP